ncbi:deoxyribonuclease-2-beta-like [Protopterus annectens]|uniref:deoxyribonuclease-2-beta-like n=1 Tax=Protopterus annectens TaxID=7888 RepID=UPI001CFA7520|nr:deoxyribonuclease-2-beta-like [Protopterus annectens]
MPPNHWCFNLIEIILFLVPVKTAFSSCRNETGHPVDWFVLYKLPRYQINKTSGSGLDYLYLDPTTGGWYPSKNLINTTQSALGQTLQHLYEAYKSQENTTAYMMYNDAPVNKAYNKRYGHTKASSLDIACKKSVSFETIEGDLSSDSFHQQEGKENGSTPRGQQGQRRKNLYKGKKVR